MLLVPTATILYDIKKGSTVKDKEKIVCRNGHEYSTPFVRPINHPCRQCKAATQERYYSTINGRYGRYFWKLRKRIKNKRERIQQLEQEIARRNGGV